MADTGVANVEKKIRGYRKAGQMGNSIGVVIPKDIVDALKIKAGDEFEVTADLQTSTVTIKPAQRIVASPQLIQDLEEFMDEYEETFKELKEK